MFDILFPNTQVKLDSPSLFCLLQYLVCDFLVIFSKRMSFLSVAIIFSSPSLGGGEGVSSPVGSWLLAGTKSPQPSQNAKLD